MYSESDAVFLQLLPVLTDRWQQKRHYVVSPSSPLSQTLTKTKLFVFNNPWMWIVFEKANLMEKKIRLFLHTISQDTATECDKIKLIWKVLCFILLHIYIYKNVICPIICVNYEWCLIRLTLKGRFLFWQDDQIHTWCFQTSVEEGMLVSCYESTSADIEASRDQQFVPTALGARTVEKEVSSMLFRVIQNCTPAFPTITVTWYLSEQQTED